LRGLKAHIKGLDEAVEKAHDALMEMSPGGVSIKLDGMVFSEHEAIDSHFDYLGIPEENIDKTIALLESYRKTPLTPEQKAEREAGRRRAHEELDALQVLSFVSGTGGRFTRSKTFSHGPTRNWGQNFAPRRSVEKARDDDEPRHFPNPGCGARFHAFHSA
jgi:hypothetical protein